MSVNSIVIPTTQWNGVFSRPRWLTRFAAVTWILTFLLYNNYIPTVEAENRCNRVFTPFIAISIISRSKMLSVPRALIPTMNPHLIGVIDFPFAIIHSFQLFFSNFSTFARAIALFNGRYLVSYLHCNISLQFIYMVWCP